MVLPLFDSNSLSSRLITIWYTDIIVIPCSSGDHGVKNFGLWHQCTVTPPQIFVVSRPLVVDDGNGDGWVEGGNYNPGSMSGGYYGPEGVYNPNVPPFDPNTDFALVKGQITRPLGARPTAEQNFFNNDLNPDQKYILQHNSAVRTIILNFLNANKLSNNAFKEDAKFSAKQMLTLLAGDASQANLDHCQELAEFLTENGGTIEFSSAVTAQNSVSFEDFVELMALPLVADEPHYSLNGDQVLATQKFYRNWLYDIEVDVVQELTPYSVVDVDSDLVGVTYAHGWEQGVFVPHTTALGNMDLKVRGTELHYITAGGLGEVYRRKLTLGMYIDKTDGHIFGQYTE